MSKQRVTPRHVHDHMRARELVRGITSELEGRDAFEEVMNGVAVSKELCAYTQELAGIVRRYHPSDYYEDDE